MRKYLGGDSPTCIIGMETQTCFVLDEWIAQQRYFTYVRGVTDCMHVTDGMLA